MEVEKKTWYTFDGVGVNNGAPFTDNKYFHIKGKACFDSGDECLGVAQINFSIPISEKAVREHTVQELSQQTIELMKRCVQDKPLSDWFEQNSEPT